MKRLPSILAGLIALGACVAAAWASLAVFERMPHLEDEFANLWQAEVMADGEIALPSPDFPRSSWCRSWSTTRDCASASTRPAGRRCCLSVCAWARRGW